MQKRLGARAAGQGLDLAPLEEKSGEVGLVCGVAAVKEGCFVDVVTRKVRQHDFKRVCHVETSIHCALVVLELDELCGEFVMCLGYPGV